MNNISYVLGAIILFLGYWMTVRNIQPAVISATGTGEIRVQPDRVVINIGIQTRDASVHQATRNTDIKAANVINYLQAQGIAPKDIQTSFVSLQPYYPYTGYETSTTPEYYTASKSMTFVLRNLSSYDNIMSGLYEIGINSVSGISFEASNVAEHREEARGLAATNAKKAATTLTASLGVNLGDVHSISDSINVGGQPTWVNYKMMATSDLAGSGPSIAEGEVVISSTVSISFYIK